MFKNAQEKVHSIVKDYDPPYWPPLSQFARLAEEVGEVGRLLNHLYGAKPKKTDESRQKLDEELADVLFTVVCLANAHDIDLDAAFDGVLQKFHDRDAHRFEKKV